MYTLCIAEDEYYVQKSLEARIRALNADIEIKGFASNGYQALRLFLQINPDLFLVDIHMPDCDGLQFIRKCKEETGTSAKFIIISGYNDFRYMKAAIQFSVFDYILKPIDGEELTHSIHRAIAGIQEERQILASSKKTDGDISDLPDRLRLYLEDHFYENVTLTDLARRFHVSASYLSHYFKRKAGVSIIRYLETFRLNRAKEILETTTLPIAEISCRVGYADNNYFAKIFRKETGLSPSDYRRWRQGV